MYTLEGSSIFWKFLTTLMMRSLTSLLSRNDPFASSEDIHRRPDRASCSAAAGLRDAADDGAAAKRNVPQNQTPRRRHSGGMRVL